MVDVKASASAHGNVNQNMYRVGEFVYLDSKGAHPYLIRRIEEFTKNQNGVNDVRVTIVYRRRDISTAILRVADAAERHWPDYLVYDEATGEEKAAEKQKVEVNENGEIEVTSVPIEPPTNGQDIKKENGTATRKERKEKPEKLSEKSEEKEDTPEKEEPEEEEKEKSEESKDEMQPFDWGVGGLPFDANTLSEEDRYKLRQREVFLSRKEEKLNVSHIRGKCSVNLLCDVETSDDYLSREDAYFYSLVYDNDKLSMLADKGAIRVGPQYQAILPGEEVLVQTDSVVKDELMETDENKENGDLMIDEDDVKKEIKEEEEICREACVYLADNGLSHNDIDRYLIHVRAVGVFARVIDPNSAIKYPSAQMIAALASKDSTIFYAYGLLHKAGYNIGLAQDFLVPPANKNKIPTDIDDNMGFNTLTIGGPLLVRDQLEEYSAPDSVLFEEGIDKIGKDFSEIRNQLLQWKSLASIVEYYYLFKTTSRYIDGRKKRNAIEKEGRLLQVYVPNCAETTAYLAGAFNSTEEKVVNEKGCNGCSTTTAINWYKWGNRGDDAILCQDCWKFWRHYGGLQVRNKLDHFDTNIAADPDVAQELLKSLSYATPSCSKTGKDPKRYGANSYTMYTVVSASDLNQNSAVNAANAKQKGHINMKTNLFTKVIRRAIPKSVLSVKKCGRNPFINLNMTKISSYVTQMDQNRICEVMKAIAAPKVNVPATTFQQLVSDLMTQFSSGSNKRPASASLEGQPPAKKAPALSYLPYMVEENSQGSGVYSFLSGPVYRRHRRQQINRNLARRLGRRPLHNNSDLLPIVVSSCEPIDNSPEQSSYAPSIHIL